MESTSGMLRFGCHDFLNSSVILYPLKEGLLENPFDLTMEPPARLAEMLKDGQLDMAFIPAIEYARIPGLKIVPGFEIAARGEVKTVLVVSRKRMWDIESVATDHRSRTSIALLKILLKEHFHGDARLQPAKSGNLEEMLQKSDAALVIGDEAFSVDKQAYNVYDLSSAWFAFTGRPFVFALLCVRDGINAEREIELLHSAKRLGLQNLDSICLRAAQTLNIAEDICRNYLTERIRYDLNNEDIEGLKEFYELAHKHHLASEVKDLLFYGDEKGVIGENVDSSDR